jgi:hypothetical protein
LNKLERITLNAKRNVLRSEQMLTAQVDALRHMLERGLAEEPGPLMLNREAVLNYRTPGLVTRAHLMHKVLRFRRQLPQMAAMGPADPVARQRLREAEYFAQLRRLVRDEDFEILKRAGVSEEEIAKMQGERRTAYWRVLRPFLRIQWDALRMRLAECSSRRDWTDSPEIWDGAIVLGACASRLVLAGALSYVQGPKTLISRLVNGALAPFQELALTTSCD